MMDAVGHARRSGPTNAELAILLVAAALAYAWWKSRPTPAGNVTVGEITPLATVTAAGEVPWGKTGYVATPAPRAADALDPNSLDYVLQLAVDNNAAAQAAADAEFDRRRLLSSYNLDAQ